MVVLEENKKKPEEGTKTLGYHIPREKILIIFSTSKGVLFPRKENIAQNEDGNRDEQLIRILSTPNRYDRTMKTHTHTWLPASTTTTTVGYAGRRLDDTKDESRHRRR
ncbi:unnamed protein product [Cylicostephanus goldi]|uniref:Uncharacterized protein n=1 Tax=Cylicostephanus goldi TaxID=71465 RepID=A0A3P6R1B1_CYLGO|nr:unnamed protein product [Cylicostephanus goldi]